MIGNIWNALVEIDNGVLLSCFIAMLALIFTAYQSSLTRKHNKISVRPLIKITTQHGDGKKNYSIDFNNHGLGPAIVTKVIIYVDGVNIGVADNDYNWNKAIVNAKKGTDDVSFVYFTLFKNAGSINSGESCEAMFTKEVENNVVLDSIFEKFHFKIEYESLYGEKFTEGFNS